MWFFSYRCLKLRKKTNLNFGSGSIDPLVQSVMVGPVTEWNQAPFFAWEFPRSYSNFQVRRIKSFCPPSWFFAAIFYFSTPKRLCVMKYFFKSQPMNVLSPDHYWMFSRVYKKIDKFYIFSHLNSAVFKKYEYNSNFVEYRLLYILLRTLSSDLVIKYLLADF